MSGYFRRLVTQSAITATQLRPAVHPYAVPTGTPALPIVSDPLEFGRSPETAAHRFEAGSASDPRPSEGPAESRRIVARPPQIGDRAIVQAEPAAPLDESDPAGGVSMPEQRPQRAAPASPQHSVTGAAKPVESRRGGQMRSERGRQEAFVPSPASGRADSNFRLLPELSAPPVHPALATPRRPDSLANGAPTSPAVFRAMTTSDDGGREAAQVHVTIGRIEVIAQHAQPPARKRRERPAAASLDEYLSRRRQGGV